MRRTYAAGGGHPVRHARPRGEEQVTYGPGAPLGSGAVPALAQPVGPDRPQEVDAAEVRPVGLAEVELAVRALPEQEAAQPLLPRRADDEVGVGLALGVEVLGDVLDVDDVGELLEAGAGGGVLVEQRA